MKKLLFFTVMLSIPLFFASHSYAYLDPGSGSVIWQIILGAVASVIVFLKFFWQRLFALFGLKRKEQDNPEQLDTKR